VTELGEMCEYIFVEDKEGAVDQALKSDCIPWILAPGGHLSNQKTLTDDICGFLVKQILDETEVVTVDDPTTLVIHQGCIDFGTEFIARGFFPIGLPVKLIKRNVRDVDLICQPDCYCRLSTKKKKKTSHQLRIMPLQKVPCLSCACHVE
jgi:hypothetical protein